MENRLKEFRVKTNLSQKDLAESIGISVTYYCNIENNQRTPSLTVAFALSDFFEVLVEDLFLLAKETNPIKNN